MTTETAPARPDPDLRARVEEIIATAPACCAEDRRADLMLLVAKLEEAGLE